MPRISIKAPDLPEFSESLPAGPIVIGRVGGENDLSIQDDRLSRTHCRILPEEAGYCVVDLESVNGTMVNGIRIKRPYWLQSGDVIEIGGTRILYVAETEEDAKDESISAAQTVFDQTDHGDETVESAPPVHLAQYVIQYMQAETRKLLRLGTQPLQIGRNPSCGLVFDDTSLSACHAQIELRADGYYIVDMGSTNGVMVNGQKVEQARLRPGTRIRLGRAILGFKELVSRPDTPGA